jgi:hypothetical protein
MERIVCSLFQASLQVAPFDLSRGHGRDAYAGSDLGSSTEAPISKSQYTQVALCRSTAPRSDAVPAEKLNLQSPAIVHAFQIPHHTAPKSSKLDYKHTKTQY